MNPLIASRVRVKLLSIESSQSLDRSVVDVGNETRHTVELPVASFGFVHPLEIFIGKREYRWQSERRDDLGDVF